MSSIPERYSSDRQTLAAVLRRLRATRFASGSKAAWALAWSQSKISKIETGRLLPSTEDVELLLDICQATDPVRVEALDLVERLHSTLESNRTILRQGAARKQAAIARVEDGARVLGYVALSVIPGLLQSAEYMRCIFALELSGEELARAMRARKDRQRALDDAGKSFTFILTENALRWRFVPDQVMAGQLERIIALSRRPNVTLGVIPLSQPVADVPLHGFEVFDDRLVTIGLEHATMTATDPRDVAVYTRMMTRLSEAARCDEDARGMLTRLISAVNGSDQ